MVTLKEIAEECGVSVSTVSNVLNGRNKSSQETTDRVMKVVREREYEPNPLAQGLRSQRTKLIGIIAEDIAQFTTPEIVEGIMKNLEGRGYSTIVSNLRLYARWSDTWYGNEEEHQSVLRPVLQRMLLMHVDGIIYIAGHARLIHCFPKNFKTPAVMTYGFASNPDVPSIVLDDEDAAYTITRYLIEHGHRDIAVIGGMPDNMHTRKRLLGYQRALFEANILYNTELIRFANWDMQGGYKEIRALEGQKFSAVFCMCDRIAGGVYQYLHEKGLRAGEDLSVAGFDNQDISEFFTPGLTTMQLPLSEIGAMAADCLTDQIENPKPVPPHQEIPIRCALIERESVCEVRN